MKTKSLNNFQYKKVLDPKKEYLEGPNSRGAEFWFLVKLIWQFLSALRKLHFVGPCITVFGSARFKDEHPSYKLGEKVGAMISKMGFNTMTGGGPGIMEAANRGAYENGGYSIGCTIKLPQEQTHNKYLNKRIPFDYFFLRKVMLLKYSYGFMVLPGGYGTLDELFETLTLIQTGIIHDFPIVIMDKAYYEKVESLINEMIELETISIKDKDLVLFTDDIDKAESHIEKYISNNYSIKTKKSKPLWWLGEK